MPKRSVILVSLVAVAVGAAAWRLHWNADAAIPRAAPAAPRIPVKVAEAKRADVPVTLSGLGVVQPLNVVTIRSRVDGAIVEIGFEEGQTVKKGDLIAQIDPRPYQASLDQAKARKAQNEAMLANAQRDLARSEQLAQSNYASRQQVDGQKANVAQLKAAVAGDAAAVESAEVQLGYTTIRAPMDGRVGFRLVDEGNLVRSSDATGIVTLSQLQPITAVLTLPERDFPDVSAAMMRGGVRATAFTPDGRKLGDGALSVLNSQIDQATGTFKAKATFANGDGALWPGQSVSVRVLVSTLENVVTAPEDALQRSPAGYYAFVVKGDATAERRDIAVGRQADGLAVVTRGIEPGESVVTAGASRLQPGSRVEATAASVAAKEKPGDGAPTQ